MTEDRRQTGDRRATPGELSIAVGRVSVTPRQLEILGLVAGGLGNKAIAERIGKNENDVKAIISRLLTKLHAANRAELAQIASLLDVIGESDLVAHEIHELLRNSPVLTALVRGPDHRFVFVNDAYKRRAGDFEYLGKTFAQVFPSSALIVDQLDRVYATGDAQRSNARLDLPVTTGPGAGLELSWIMTPICDDADEITGVAFFGLDVGESRS